MALQGAWLQGILRVLIAEEIFAYLPEKGNVVLENIVQ